MNNKTFVIAGGTKGVAKQVVIELVKTGNNVVFGDLGDNGKADDLLNELKAKAKKNRSEKKIA